MTEQLEEKVMHPSGLHRPSSHRAQPHQRAPEEVSSLEQDGNCIHPYGELALNSRNQELAFVRVSEAILEKKRKENLHVRKLLMQKVKYNQTLGKFYHRSLLIIINVLPWREALLYEALLFYKSVQGPDGWP